MPPAIACVAFIAASWPVIIPDFHDAHGWGLRIERLTGGPYIVGETYENIRVRITLANRTEQLRTHWPLGVAVKAGDLSISLTYPDGRAVRRHFELDLPRVGDAEQKLEAGKSVSADLALRDFGFQQLLEPGRYRAQALLKTSQGKVVSFPWSLDVVEPAPTDVLAAHIIPLDELEARRGADDRSKAVVQQIKLGDRVFLVYRSFGRGSKNVLVPDRCIRLAEIPQKVDMKVTGEYGRGKTLTIVFDDAKEPDGKRTIVIDSK